MKTTRRMCRPLPGTLGKDQFFSEGLYCVLEGHSGSQVGFTAKSCHWAACDLGQMASLLWPPWSVSIYPINPLFLNQLDRNAAARRSGAGARVHRADLRTLGKVTNICHVRGVLPMLKGGRCTTPFPGLAPRDPSSPFVSLLFQAEQGKKFC